MSLAVEIAGRAIPRLPRREITRFVRQTVREIARGGAASFEPDEVSIAFVDDETMRRLNHRFRRKNRTTDVLTFPADEPDVRGERPLGEIVIAIGQAKRQAAEQRHALATEVRYLLLHGLIHAFGYDHETDSGEMNALELSLRARVGLD